MTLLYFATQSGWKHCFTFNALHEKQEMDRSYQQLYVKTKAETKNMIGQILISKTTRNWFGEIVIFTLLSLARAVWLATPLMCLFKGKTKE